MKINKSGLTPLMASSLCIETPKMLNLNTEFLCKLKQRKKDNLHQILFFYPTLSHKTSSIV